jgi:hypothetical protein
MRLFADFACLIKLLGVCMLSRLKAGAVSKLAAQAGASWALVYVGLGRELLKYIFLYHISLELQHYYTC